MEYTLIIKTLSGLEDVLAKEVQVLGGRDVSVGSRLVNCTGDLGFVYKANFSLRTALRVLVPQESFSIKNQDDYYKYLLSFDWSQWMKPSDTFKVSAITHSELFTNSHYAELLCKDAIVDFFQNKEEERPSVNKETPDFYVHIYVYKNKLTLFFDSSGESLHKRGYKTQTHEASLNEVLAAGMLKIAQWDGKGNLLDPMCGGATLPIEAAMIAMEIPPQIHRESFAFEKWPNFDADLWNQIRDSRISKIKELKYTILSQDKDADSLEIARQNIESADLSEFIKVEQINFFESKKTVSPLLIIMNPPYNVRLSHSERDFNKKIGNCLKANYPNTICWILSAETNLWKEIELRSDKMVSLYNSNLECRFKRYIIND